ncbi:MAG: phytanoyl-CoA dioxygenase family protein [Verrucomicrobia bacterium]|nr:phytanoyl-CoA dioxygenase family protein [Verrucomicrobiota bacterium]
MQSLVQDRYRNVSDDTLAAWIAQFHRDGFLFLEDVLHADVVKALKADLEASLGGENTNGTNIYGMQIQMRMFESSRANVDLFDLEPIVTFAEKLVAPNCHVFHNNSFKTERGGGISGWHQDDDPHYIVTDGQPPTNVHLPVMFFTANYYLTDVDSIDHGPTQLVRGSHLLGSLPPKSKGATHGEPDALDGTPYEDRVFSCLGKAGSVILFNNQVWHRGAPNQSDRVRYITQVSYGRRIIGHKYKPYMNYQMPEHVYAGANARRMRLLGFLTPGPYG